jgi:hypothetical protein
MKKGSKPQSSNSGSQENSGSTSIFKGGFEFRLVPTKGNGETTHYLHIFRGEQCLTPKDAGAFVNLERGKWNPVIINDRSYEIPLVMVIKEYFGNINTIKYVKPGTWIDGAKGFHRFKGKSKTIWNRFNNY